MGSVPTAGPASVVIQRRVEWSDTDGAGHQHFTAVLRWVESAEAVLHERLGLLDRTWPRIPRVHLEVDFLARLWHRDLVDVTVWVQRVGRASLQYGFEVRRGPQPAARGSYTVVFSDPSTDGSQPWPDDIRQTLTTAGPQPPELLGAG